ncbi:hypothetical protein C8Q72DRAFT_394605 [Fomitopsis betulina]|nr:hypothetical protein C8Q72DRAFT_394605 [Fomitopsis betulina]
MSRRQSYESNYSTKSRAKKLRCQSASQIARNKENFVTWSEHQNLEEVSLGDLPTDLGQHASVIFDVTGQLSKAWIKDLTGAKEHIEAILPHGFSTFIRSASKSAPEIFSVDKLPEDPLVKELLSELQTVFSTWTKLTEMSKSSRKWSEADYAANIYNVIRGPAIRQGNFRAQCPVALPQPLSIYRPRVKPGDVRILNAKTVCPDGSVFVPKRSLKHLSETSSSIFNELKKMTKGTLSSSGSIGGKSDFRYQATPCTMLSDGGGFDFISSFWEDKKHEHIDAACRQNRMATAAAVRQLHALRVRAPVFGLVWAQGTVRAHVDWWEEIEGVDDSGQTVTIPVVRSAPYGGASPRSRRTSRLYHEWDLRKPADILRVYLLIKNIDRWTVNGFIKCINGGIRDLRDGILNREHTLVPWKRNGDIAVAVQDVREGKGRSTQQTGNSATPVSTPPKRRRKRVLRSS